MSAVRLREAMNSLGSANSQIARDVTTAGKTDIFLAVSLHRLATVGRFRRRAADGPRTKDRIMMSDRLSHNLDGLDIDLARCVDEVCRRFEADWRQGRHLAPGTQVWLACRPIDPRKGFNGLAAQVAEVLGPIHTLGTCSCSVAS